MTTSPDWLETAARRSVREPWMLGHAFARYRELEGHTPEQLAAELGCTLEVLQWLSLCRRPEGETFTEQVFTIAKRFAVEPVRLITVLRRVEVVDALTTQEEGDAATNAGSLPLAARDRPHGDDETGP